MAFELAPMLYTGVPTEVQPGRSKPFQAKEFWRDHQVWLVDRGDFALIGLTGNLWCATSVDCEDNIVMKLRGWILKATSLPHLGISEAEVALRFSSEHHVSSPGDHSNTTTILDALDEGQTLTWLAQSSILFIKSLRYCLSQREPAGLILSLPLSSAWLPRAPKPWLS